MSQDRQSPKARISPLSAALVALVVLVAGGFVHGKLADRWETAPALLRALDQLKSVPTTIGAWQGRDSDAISAKDFEKAGALGYVARTYQHPDGSNVELILMCGRPSRMGAHTPEICYGGVGYELAQPPALVEIKGTDGEQGRFRRGHFTKPATRSSDLSLYWSWNAGGSWNAPDWPRMTYLFEPYLYKMYLSQAHSGRTAEGNDGAERFLRELLPTLKETLKE